MKLLLKIVAGLLVLLLVVAIAGWIWIDSIAKKAVVEGMEYALGVESSLDDMSVSLLKGTVGMDGLEAGKVKGYEKGPWTFRIEKIRLGVNPGSLMEDTIVVNEFIVDGLDLHWVMKNRTSNINALIEYMNEKFKSPDAPPAEDGKKVQVDKIVFRNIAVHFYVEIIPGQFDETTVEIDEIILDDVSSEEGVTIDQIVVRILPKLIPSLIEAAGKRGLKLPGGILKGLGGGIENLGKNLGGGFGKIIEGSGGLIKGGGSVVDGTIKGTGKVVDDLIHLRNPIEGLLPGDKDKGKDDEKDDEKDE